MIIAAFLVTALLLAVAVHWYLWWRLVRGTTRRGHPARRAGTIALVALAVLLVAALAGSRTLPPAGQKIVAWPGYLWLALLFYLVVILLAVEVPALPLRLWLRHRDEARRLRVNRWIAAVAGACAVVVVATGLHTAFAGPVRRQVSIRLAKLPARLDGLRIAFVSDLHLGPILGRAQTQGVVDAINDLRPDIVAVVGDLVDGPVPDLRTEVEPLRGLRPRLGAFFVTGNHEYYSGYRPWLDKISSLGLRVLRNERVELDGLYLAGVNDASGERVGDPPDYGRALDGRDPGKPVVLLAHQPVQATEAARHGVDLQLSGHTHGGQMWPFDYVVGAEQPVVDGVGRVAGVPVVVSAGAGSWGPPVRVGAPPDVTLVILRAP